MKRDGRLLFIAIVLLLVLQHCKCRNTFPPIEVKSSVKAIHGIAFIDVNDAILKNVRNVKVTLIDPEKMVLSSNGSRFEQIVLPAGVVSIGLSAEAKFSIEKPYRLVFVQRLKAI